MRFFLVIAAMLPALAGALPASAKDCPIRSRSDRRAAAIPGCGPEAPRPLREEAVEAQQRRGDRGGGTTIQLGGRVRGEAFGQSRGR
jgi:hypothetical protein